jgi:hypothetical protein
LDAARAGAAGDPARHEPEGVTRGYHLLIPDTVERAGLGSNPHLIRLAANLAYKKGSALSKINVILGDKRHPYWGPAGPATDAAIEEVQRLYREAYGS